MTVSRTKVFLDHLCHRSAAAIWRDRRYKEGARPDIRGSYYHRSLFRTSVFIPYELPKRDPVSDELRFTVRGCKSFEKAATLAALRLAVLRSGRRPGVWMGAYGYQKYQGNRFATHFVNRGERYAVDCDDKQVLRYLLTKARASLDLEKARAFDSRYGDDSQVWTYLKPFIRIEKV